MKRFVLLFLLCTPALAQDSDPIAKGDWNVAVFAGGGHSIKGSTNQQDGALLSGGLHLGKVLTGDHGPGFLQGKFELGIDVTPLNAIWQEGDAAYGFGFSPALFKWHFTSSQKVVPYLELGGGMLWTSDGVPPGSANFNFTPQATIGFQFLRDEKKALSVSARYMHISNAGRMAPNPGVNTLQVMLAWHWFK